MEGDGVGAEERRRRGDEAAVDTGDGRLLGVAFLVFFLVTLVVATGFARDWDRVTRRAGCGVG